MIRGRHIAFALLLLVAFTVGAAAFFRNVPKVRSSRVSSDGGMRATHDDPVESRTNHQLLPDDIRWIGAGGGSEPASNQVSLEQDLVLASSVLGSNGVVLFAGGTDALSVQVGAEEPRGDPLLRQLGDIFDPRDSRNAIYRRPIVGRREAATLENVQLVLEHALAHGTEPLLVYLLGHGEPGEATADATLHLWGGNALGVRDLSEALDRPRARAVRVVMTSCHAGGFADIVFKGADPTRGSAFTPRCGLFATTWEDEASGCDPNPDRAAQEGYGLHFLHALRGEDRHGQASARDDIDIDHDGQVSLLEAHTRARIEGNSIDLPTSTSERWLRHVAPSQGPTEEASLAEEDAVIEKLGARLGLETESSARAALVRIERRMQELEDETSEADLNVNEAWAHLRIALLERWPMLDDPWHPDFEATLRTERANIEAFLARSPEHDAYEARQEVLTRSLDELDPLRVKAARVGRLVRAYETRLLAGRLRAKGGKTWNYYERLLACERTMP